jgi:glycosyltransferase involved in cell wall biosynthesis
MRVKILDAWAHGLPVVSTSVGAEGMAYTDGEDIIIADHPDEFAHRLVEILSHVEVCQRLGRAGRTSVEKHYDWAKIYPAWDTIYAV